MALGKLFGRQGRTKVGIVLAHQRERLAPHSRRQAIVA